MNEAPYRIPPIPYLRLRYTLEAERACRLSTHKGSMARGAFGHALRRSVCLRDLRQDCGQCPFRESCAYAKLFECRVEGPPPPFMLGQPMAARPYAFEAPDTRRDYDAGDRMDIDLLLFGQAVKLQGYATLAMARMARAGLGPRRHPFRLVGVRHQDAKGRWRDLGKVADGSLPTSLAPALVPDLSPHAAERATLHLLTPTRLKIKGRIASEFGFRALAFKILRRTLELAHFHVPGATPDWHFQPLLQAADKVRIVSTHTRWHTWTRYSSRQGQAIKLPGIVGDLHLEGDLTPFTPLLKLAEIIHIGKATTFGLGKVAVSW